jgi:hypothetical protein
VAGVVGQGLVEFAAYGVVAAGLALVVVGIAYAGFEAVGAPIRSLCRGFVFVEWSAEEFAPPDM